MKTHAQRHGTPREELSEITDARGHLWSLQEDSRPRLESGEAVRHLHCYRCGRDVVMNSMGVCRAAYVSMLSLYVLNDEVTKRWLAEPCPGERLESDDKDREKVIY